MIRKSPVDGADGTILHGPSMSIANWSFAEGTILPEHAHPHDQIALVIEGELELTISGTTSVLKAGDAAAIPGNVPHSARARTACRLVDAFHPVRDDLK